MTQHLNNPYVGPRTFSREESDRYFGRERESRELFSLVMSERLVLFYAQSGAGKSSLINTRLIPQLQQADFSVLPVGRVSGDLPEGVAEVDNIYLFNLMLNLDQGDTPPAALAHLNLTGFLAHLTSTDGLTYYYDDKVELSLDDDYEEAPYVLIIDQFEEIVSAHPDRWQDRAGFFKQLDQAMLADPNLWVVLTLREDYIAALDPFAHLLTDKMRARFYMQRMGYRAALQAVSRPAQLGGRTFAGGVAKTLVDNLRQIRAHGKETTEVGEFVEPVQLQVVCYQLWENLRDRPSDQITQQDVDELGDVDTALAQFYEQSLATVLAQTGDSEIDVRNWFEGQLITEAGTRGMVYQGSENTGGLANETVNLLANQFLLRAEIRAGGTWYELVHDRFVEPIRQANQDWQLRQSGLVQAALAWEEAGRNEDSLYRGLQLKAAQASVQGQAIEPLVEEFLQASQKFNQVMEEREAFRRRELEQAQELAEAERQRAEDQARSSKRLRRQLIALGAVFLLAVVAAVYAFFQQRAANEAAEDAAFQATRAEAEASTAEARRVEAETAQQQAEEAALARATAQAEAEASEAVAKENEAAAIAAREDAERQARLARASQLATQAQAAPE